LPMRWVWKLNASRASKIGLSIVFALGFLDIIVAILRIVYLVNTNVSTDPDFTFDLTNTFVWSVIEPSLGVIVACGALLRPIFRKCLPNIFLCSGESLTTYSLNGQKNPRQYSNISNDEFLLQRLGATNSRDQAGPNFHPTTASEVRGRADSPKAAEERLENDVGKIIVQNEFTVERDLANSS
ncbi:MAG: hypothetical protein M1822_002548, partial [Bathelium mastoideum]